MRNRKDNFQQGPVFGKIFEWDWHKRLSLIVLAVYAFLEIYFAEGRIVGAVFTVIYSATFPILWIWFAEYLEDFLSELAWIERFRIPLESVIRFGGWLLLLALLAFSLANFWS